MGRGISDARCRFREGVTLVGGTIWVSLMIFLLKLMGLGAGSRALAR